MPSSRSLLIIAPSIDLHARGVRAEAMERGVRAVWFDLAELAAGDTLQLRISEAEAAILTRRRGDSVDLRQITTIWWRRPNPPSALRAEDDVRTRFLTDEWSSFCQSLEWCLDARWVNVPSHERAASSRVRQLYEAKTVGLRVPRTLLTNDPQAVVDFMSTEESVIYKRIGSSRAAPPVPTRLLVPDDLPRLEALHDCPAIFQEHVPARADIRVTFIGNECFSAEIHSSKGGYPVDSRLDLSVPILIHKLDSSVAAQLQALMSRLGLSFGTIDLRLTPDGEYVFLEINPSGQFLYIELLTGLPLTGHLADFLINDCNNR